MEREKVCGKCSGTMEEGFVMDRTYGANVPEEWVEGAPVRSIWVGLKLKNVTRRKVSTYRCTRCGYLESYAVETTS